VGPHQIREQGGTVVWRKLAIGEQTSSERVFLRKRARSLLTSIDFTSKVKDKRQILNMEFRDLQWDVDRIFVEKDKCAAHILASIYDYHRYATGSVLELGEGRGGKESNKTG
jgi:hypothetical protein